MTAITLGPERGTTLLSQNHLAEMTSDPGQIGVSYRGALWGGPSTQPNFSKEIDTRKEGWANPFDEIKNS